MKKSLKLVAVWSVMMTSSFAFAGPFTETPRAGAIEQPGGFFQPQQPQAATTKGPTVLAAAAAAAPIFENVCPNDDEAGGLAQYSVSRFSNGMVSYTLATGTRHHFTTGIPTEWTTTNNYFVATFSNGLFSYNMKTRVLRQMQANRPTKVLLTPSFAVMYYSNGLFVQSYDVSSTAKQIANGFPTSVMVNNRYVIATFSDGLWRYDLAAAAWKKIDGGIPAETKLNTSFKTCK
jgi:hypothetical protein